MKSRLDEIEARLAATSPAPWSGSGNLPFYATLDKPGPSLSKHDSERNDYWKVEDVEFVLSARNGDMQFLIDEVERLQLENDTLHDKIQDLILDYSLGVS